jgi:hypothetical protein
MDNARAATSGMPRTGETGFVGTPLAPASARRDIIAIHHEPLVQPIDDAHVEADVREIFRATTEKGYQDAS